ncbi:MAG: 50S ribosomal protein L4 [Candidatus Odinarchaeia archaeon]
MRKVNAYTVKGRKSTAIELPPVFNTPYRPDLIKRAVLAIQSACFQPYGRNPMAGKRTTAISLGPGRGIARVPRTKGSGYRGANVGAFAPQTVGGRVAHPPRAEKNLKERINKKERRLAIRSAIAATANKELVEKRGHRIEKIKELPLIVSDEIEEISTTSEAMELFKSLGVIADIIRAKENVKIRAGKGRNRGRKYKKPKGPLIVISEDKGIVKAVRNIAGVDVVRIDKVNCNLLAPGTHAGRLTIYSKSAIEKLREGLFN